MADQTKKPRTRSGKKIGRIRIGLSVLAQIVLVLFLAAMVNSFAFKHYARWDFSRDQKYALSDKTKRFLHALKGKMRVTVFFLPDAPIVRVIGGDVESLLTEYQYASKGKIDIENVDLARNLSRAKELADKYKLIGDESQLIIDYEGHNKTVKASEIADIDQSGMAFGEGPRVTAFKGEQAITSAMIELVEGKKNVVGYLSGHKEPAIGVPPSTPATFGQNEPESPMSTLKMFIENENIKFQELNLFNEPQIPSDIKMVMIVGPQYDLSNREMKLLRDFWDKQGRIVLLLDPAAKTPKLDAFLAEVGVKVNDDRVVALVRTGIQEIASIRTVIGHFLGGTPITKRLENVQNAFAGETCSISLDPARARTMNIQLHALIEAEKSGGEILPPGYWGKTDYLSDDPAKMKFDATRDHPPPINIAVSVEKGGSEDERVQMNSSRMVVVSNATFVENNALTQQAADFVSGSLNWLLGRQQLIGIAPKIPKPLTFSLNEEALRRLRWIILVFIPLVPTVIGTMVWWQRRV